MADMKRQTEGSKNVSTYSARLVSKELYVPGGQVLKYAHLSTDLFLGSSRRMVHHQLLVLTNNKDSSAN